MPVFQRRKRDRIVGQLAALQVDKALVVRALDLKAVGRRAGAVLGGLAVLVALRIVRRGATGGVLRVFARHDDDAVVVVRVEDRCLDAAVLALLEEARVDALQHRSAARTKPAQPFAGAQLVAVTPGVGDIGANQRQ